MRSLFLFSAQLIVICGLLCSAAFSQSSSSSIGSSEISNRIESDSSKEFVVNDAVIFESAYELDFTPQQATIIAGFDTGEVFTVSAAIIPPQRLAKDSSDVARWWFAAPTRIPVGAHTATWFARIVSPAGKVYFTAANMRTLGQVDSVAQARAEVADLSTQTSAATKDLAALEKEMTRLRGEADAIGNFGRIIDAQEELGRVEGELSQLADQSVSVEIFLQKAQSFAVPGNQVAREQQLTREIASIAEATQKAERNELMRKASSDQEAKRMMAALEEARSPVSQDPGYLKSLRAELTRLITMREQLETAQ